MTAKTELLLKAIIAEFCKQNFSFRSTLKIVGSIHVVVDNEKVLSCLLNETRESTTAAMTVAVEQQQQQPQQQSNPTTVIEKAAQTKVDMSVSKLNKRKRFVPRAHQSPPPQQTEESANDTTVIGVESLCLNEDVAVEAVAEDESGSKVDANNVKLKTMSKESDLTVSTSSSILNKNAKTEANNVYKTITLVENLAAEEIEHSEDDEETEQQDEDEFVDVLVDDAAKTQALVSLIPLTNNTNKSSKTTTPKAAAGKIVVNSGGDQQQQQASDFECEQCGKTFKYQCYYKRHMDALHSNEPKYVCEICKKSYKWEASFRHHLRTHFARESAQMVALGIDTNKEN